MVQNNKRIGLKPAPDDVSLWAPKDRLIVSRRIIAYLLRPDDREQRKIARTKLFAELKVELAENAQKSPYINDYIEEHFPLLLRGRTPGAYWNELRFKSKRRSTAKRILTAGLLVKILWKHHHSKAGKKGLTACMRELAKTYRSDGRFRHNTNDIPEAWYTDKFAAVGHLCAAYLDFLSPKTDQLTLGRKEIWAFSDDLTNFLARATAYQRFLLDPSGYGKKPIVSNTLLFRLPVLKNLPHVEPDGKLPEPFSSAAADDAELKTGS